MTDIDWESRYKSNDAPWQRDRLSPSVSLILARAKAGAQMLVPGCGRSLEPEYFAQTGFAVTGLDIARSATEWQTAQFATAGLSGQFLTVDIHDWTPPSPVDIIYEQTCLCAISPDLRTGYERQIHSWLNPGGLLLANFLQTTGNSGPPFHCDMDEMKNLFSPNRWNWGQDIPQQVDHSEGIFELAYILEKS